MSISRRASAIQQAIEDLGESASFKAIETKVKEYGVEEKISPQHVSNVKRLRKRQRERDVEDLPVSVVKKVKQLVDELGSIEVVRRALDELDKMQLGKK